MYISGITQTDILELVGAAVKGDCKNGGSFGKFKVVKFTPNVNNDVANIRTMVLETACYICELSEVNKVLKKLGLSQTINLAPFNKAISFLTADGGQSKITDGDRAEFFQNMVNCKKITDNIQDITTLAGFEPMDLMLYILGYELEELADANLIPDDFEGLYYSMLNEEITVKKFISHAKPKQYACE